MKKDDLLKPIFQIVFFVIGCGIAFLVFSRFQPGTAEKNNPVDYASTGPSEGDTVEIPELSNLNGEVVKLQGTKEKYILCAFFSTACPGCVKDSELWKDLNVEATKKKIAFHLISVDNDRDRVKRFVEAYNIDTLPILLLRDQNAQTFKIDYVPQYLLLTSSGKVVKRWMGIQENKKEIIELPDS